ncbi:hypothetical protein CEXT_256151, partial [Caerostris extrusa]
EIPDFRAIRSSLKILAMDNSRLTQLRGDNLKNLTRLWALSFVNNSITYVAGRRLSGEDTITTLYLLFNSGTENVTHFDISHNLLTYLPPVCSGPGNAWRLCGSPTTSCCTWTTSFLERTPRNYRKHPSYPRHRLDTKRIKECR